VATSSSSSSSAGQQERITEQRKALQDAANDTLSKFGNITALSMSDLYRQDIAISLSNKLLQKKIFF